MVAAGLAGFVDNDFINLYILRFDGCAFEICCGPLAVSMLSEIRWLLSLVGVAHHWIYNCLSFVGTVLQLMKNPWKNRVHHWGGYRLSWKNILHFCSLHI